MPAEYGGLLDQTYMDEIQTDFTKPSEKYWKAKKFCADIVRPSIFNRTNGPPKQASSTAWLDGLRGWAALLVYVMHHVLWAHTAEGGNKIFENAFGFDGKYYLVCLPLVRNFLVGGHFAVTTFFVISGFVLSRKPLMLIQAGEFVKLGDNLSSALFRRWLRLYLPIIATTFLYLTSWHVFGIWIESDQKETWREEVWNWYIELKNFSYVFRLGGEPWFSYNVHTWSIPVEFRGSIAIYTSLLAFSRATRNARLWCEVGLIYYFMYIVDGSHCAIFMGGMLLCDLELLAENNDLPRWFWFFESFKELIFFNLFIAALYLGGIPSHSDDLNELKQSPGWYYLSMLKPQAVFDYKFFYLFWASCALVASVPRIPSLKSFFETRFCQYLGRISFAFYLVHGPIMNTLADRLYAAVGRPKGDMQELVPWTNLFPISDAGPFGLELNFLLPHLIIFPANLWLAEIVTKLIDEPSVKFAQWLYRKILPPHPVKA
jgi:peptidoglycan/LPS O-acetylase OafA/YrhL